MGAGAIIVAAGSGDRLGYGMPKALVRAAGRPLVAWSAHAFAQARGVDAVVVVAPPGEERAVAAALGLAEHHTIAVNLAAWGGSALTDPAIAVPSEGVQAGVIPSTYVPGRNTVFIAIGLSLAEARGAERLVLGVNAVDYSGYPDCRPDYLEAFQQLATLASKAGREGHGTQLWAPLVQWSKTKIVEEALRLGVPIGDTWSCYSGGSEPCGVCDSCRIRDAALIEAGRPDLASRAGRP